jgi:MFS superfamily sulfate permease-like transporter
MKAMAARQYLRMFEPKLLTVLRAGYGWVDLRRDAIAGLTVAIVALPLAMALAETPKVFILRMRLVPIIDASGVHALRMLLQRCRKRGIVLVVSGLQAQPLRVVHQMHLTPQDGALHFVPDFESAVALAHRLGNETSSQDTER